MSRQTRARLRSRAEAHLYVAVAKADGVVSRIERAYAPHHAEQSQQHFDILKLNKEIAKTIRQDVSHVLGDPRYGGWDADRHVKEGIGLLRRAEEAGDHVTELTADKLEKDLYELAYMDGYDLRESSFVGKLLGELRKTG